MAEGVDEPGIAGRMPPAHRRPLHRLADVIFDLLDGPARRGIPFEEVQDFMHAYKEAIERILGLAAGSFTLIDDASLATWFA